MVIYPHWVPDISFHFEKVLLVSNDIEKNPGPTNNNDTPIHICHANVRSLVADLGSNFRRLRAKPPKVIERMWSWFY